MPNQIIVRNPKSWLIKYDYWLSNRISSRKKARTITVNSTYQPTRSVAEQYCRLDLLSNAVLGHSRGQYGYTGIKINFIGKGQPVLMSTKQAEGVSAAISQTAYVGGVTEPQL